MTRRALFQLLFSSMFIKRLPIKRVPIIPINRTCGWRFPNYAIPVKDFKILKFSCDAQGSASTVLINNSKIYKLVSIPKYFGGINCNHPGKDHTYECCVNKNVKL